MKTTIRDISINPLAYGTQLIIQIPDNQVDIDVDRALQIEIKPVPRRRSLNANAYYWQLVHQIVSVYGITEAEYHNRTLAELGYPFRDEHGEMKWHILPDDDAYLHQLPNETHYCPFQYTTEIKGRIWRSFYELKPSHLMDTKEMSRLIDYVVQDAQSLGIQTMTPQELEKLKQMWKPKGVEI